MITTLLFDLDGTLLDTADDLTDAVNSVFAKRGYPLKTRAEVMSFLGNGVARLISLCVPAGTDPAETEAVLAEFRTCYAAHSEEKTAPYAGILPVLDECVRRGMKLAVISNKFDDAVRALNTRYFGERIPVAIGEKMPERRKKPSPDGVFDALAKLDSTAEESIYIGDSEVDLATAENAGVPCLLCAWGFRPRAFLETLAADSKNVKAILSSPAEILRYIG